MLWKNKLHTGFPRLSTSYTPDCGKPVEKPYLAYFPHYSYNQAMASVYGIGNPLIDCLSKVSEKELDKLSLTKGTMLLVDKEKRQEILEAIKNRDTKYSCGGSCPNTMVTLRMLGIDTTLAGGIGNDEEGEIYRKRLRESGVNDELVSFDSPTGTSIILLTDDKERTMNTFLGANRLFDSAYINERTAESASLFYFTGYMWDTESQRRAVRKSLEIARRNNITVAFDIADPFAVARYRDDFLDIISDYASIVFANSEEARFLFDNYDAYECARSMGKLTRIAVVKNGRNGSYISNERNMLSIPLYGTTKPVDTTGAGDTYAAGFLFGYLSGCSVETSGKIASYLAGEIISQIGAQFGKERIAAIRESIRKEFGI